MLADTFLSGMQIRLRKLKTTSIKATILDLSGLSVLTQSQLHVSWRQVKRRQAAWDAARRQTHAQRSCNTHITQ